MHLWDSAQHDWFTPDGHYGDLSVSNVVPWETGQNFLVQRSHLAPGSGKPLHTHDDAAQLYVVLEGQLRFDTGTEQLVRRPGQAVLFEVGDPHAIHNDTEELGVVMVVTVRSSPE